MESNDEMNTPAYTEQTHRSVPFVSSARSLGHGRILSQPRRAASARILPADECVRVQMLVRISFGSSLDRCHGFRAARE